MHRLIVCFNALFLGIIIGLIFLAIFHAAPDAPRRHVATDHSFEKPGTVSVSTNLGASGLASETWEIHRP